MSQSHILKSASNHENRKESVKIGQNNHLAKKEEFIKSRSEVIQKPVKAKEQSKEEALRKEREKKEREEKRQNTFRIPKKKPEQHADVEKLINSLFDDTETPFKETQPCLSEKKDDKHKSDKDSSSKSRSTSPSPHKEKSHVSSSNGLSNIKKDLKGNTSENPSSSSHSHKDSKESSSDKHSSSSHSHKHSGGSSSDKHSSSSHSHKHSGGSSSDKHSSSSHSHKHSGGSSSDKHSSSSHSHKDAKGSSSDKYSSSPHRHKDSSSSHRHKDSSSSHSHNDSKGITSDKHSSTSHSSHNKTHSDSQSSNSGKHKSADARSSSSSQDHKHKSSSGMSKSSSGNSKSHESEHSRKDASSGEMKNVLNSSSSKSQNSLKPKEPSLPELKLSPSSSSKDVTSSGHQPSASDQLPVVLTKHHLNPTVERQASSMLSEKEKILAKLQAIKQRTLEAIHKENSGKGRRGKGEKTHRKSKNEVKHDDKTKSVEIVRDIVSSDDEDEVNNGVPSALDIMLSERTAKLEKEKISRMAKQAWERAMKKDSGEPEKEVKVKKKHKSSKRDVGSTHKHNRSSNNDKKNKRDRSLSPHDNTRKPSPKPRKPVIVRHSVQSSAPPMDFKALLEMAEKKQNEPPKPLGAVAKKKKAEEGRPLTQEEKDRKERKKTKEYQDWLKFGGKPPAKTYNSSDEDELPAASENSSDKRQTSQHSSLTDKNVALGSSKQSFSNKQLLNKDGSKNNHQVTANGDIRNKPKNITVNENILVCGPGSDDEGSESKPANPFDRIMGQFQKKRPAQMSQSAVAAKKGRFLDSDEEEEDPDMDDFIDDGEEDEPDYSHEIKKLFGYDKSKYRNEREEDLSDMEADYATVMKEEKRSAKLGLMEDLEDMRKEQEELKQKAMMKKRK